MRVGLVGLGRMGQVFAQKLSGKVNLSVYDQELDRAKAGNMELSIVQSIADFKDREVIILAVPDAAVLSCVRELNALMVPITVVSIATNVSQAALDQATESLLHAISVRIIGHAQQMALGERPFIIADDSKPNLLPMVKELFQYIGEVTGGNSDMVAKVNTLTAKAVLETCVAIERLLLEQGINHPGIIKSAISQVGAGTMQAYAKDNLGPFARKIVADIKGAAGN